MCQFSFHGFIGFSVQVSGVSKKMTASKIRGVSIALTPDTRHLKPLIVTTDNEQRTIDYRLFNGNRLRLNRCDGDGVDDIRDGAAAA